MKLIDKDTVVAEIERLKSEYIKHTRNKFHTEWACGVLDYILSFLNTLEVKEVDLEKELNDFIEQQKAWIKDNRIVEYYNGDSFNHIYDLKDIAKHFFELGLKAQKGGSPAGV